MTFTGVTLAQGLAGSAGTTFTLGYNAADQVISRVDSSGLYTARPSALGAGYTTNGLNQYAGVTGPSATYSGANAATLSYDPLGRLQSETSSSGTTYFLYDGAALVGEYGPGGTILNRYVMGPGTDEPLAWYSGAGTSSRAWYAQDQQGSVIQTADQNGNPGATTYDYGPYGEPIVQSGASAWGGPRYRYTGQIEVPGAQVYYYNARVYDPSMGRFYQIDPAGLTSDVNLYAYGGQDPINELDPSGQLYCITGDDPSDTSYLCFADTPMSLDEPRLQPIGAPGVNGGGGPGRTPQSGPPINCSTPLPNGQTVGQVVRKSISNIGNAAGPYDVGGLGELGAFIATVEENGPIDFKNNFKGSASSAFLGAAGNFAYGAIASGIGYSQGVAEFGAGGCAITKTIAHPNTPDPASANNPWAEDNSAAQTLPAGYATNGCATHG